MSVGRKNDIFDAATFVCQHTIMMSPSSVPEMTLRLGREVTPLWHELEGKLGQTNLPPPFWAFAWPGGQGMARYIFDHPELVRGRKIVDFAAGSGIVGIAAAQAGAASVLAVDIDPIALTAVKLNAEINHVDVKVSNGLDMTTAYKKADLILAGDICYQQATSSTVVRWLRLCVEAGVPVLLADPGRAYVPQDGMVKLASYPIVTSPDLEDQEERLVTVWKMDKIPENQEN